MLRRGGVALPREQFALRMYPVCGEIDLGQPAIHVASQTTECTITGDSKIFTVVLLGPGLTALIQPARHTRLPNTFISGFRGPHTGGALGNTAGICLSRATRAAAPAAVVLAEFVRMSTSRNSSISCMRVSLRRRAGPLLDEALAGVAML